MNPTRHPSNNAVLGRPADMTDDECSALAVTRIVYDLANGDQVPASVSFWQLSPEQLALLNEGKRVWLSVMGTTHPPLMLGVEGDGRLQL